MEVLARGRSVSLRRPQPGDAEAFVDAVRESADLHADWVHPPSNELAYATWVESVKRPTTESHLVVADDGSLVGVVNINNIVRGVLLSGTLGYYAFERHAGSGRMREGLSLVISRAFGELGLHRLEANIQPDNERSKRLVESLGFRLEGFSPEYLFIACAWRDHERYAIVAPN